MLGAFVRSDQPCSSRDIQATDTMAGASTDGKQKECGLQVSATSITLSRGHIPADIAQGLAVYRYKIDPKSSPRDSPPLGASSSNSCARVRSPLFKRVSLSEISQELDAVLTRTGVLPTESLIIVRTEEVPEMIVFQADPLLAENAVPVRSDMSLSFCSESGDPIFHAGLSPYCCNRGDTIFQSAKPRSTTSPCTRTVATTLAAVTCCHPAPSRPTAACKTTTTWLSPVAPLTTCAPPSFSPSPATLTPSGGNPLPGEAADPGPVSSPVPTAAAEPQGGLLTLGPCHQRGKEPGSGRAEGQHLQQRIRHTLKHQ